MAMVPSTMQEYLNRKYAILEQQANAQTTQAAATTRNAATAALTGKAQAGLDTVRAQLLPGESAASIAKMGAETGLIGQQAKYFGPEAMARIANLGAETERTSTDNKIAVREGLMERTTLPESLRAVLGARGYQGYRLGSVVGN